MEGRHKPLTTRRATRLVLKRPGRCTDADAQLIAHLQAQHPTVAVAIDLAQDFCTIVRERQADRFDDWLARAVASRVAPLQRFATGLHADYEAVKAGIRLRWSTGPVKGQINRLKMLKRSMFGRAKIDLLSRRLPAGGVTPALSTAAQGHRGPSSTPVHTVCSMATGRAFDSLLGAREATARRLELDGQVLDRRAPEQCWSSQMLLSPQPRQHIVLQSPKVRKTRMALS
jgi:hypothetical protein